MIFFKGSNLLITLKNNIFYWKAMSALSNPSLEKALKAKSVLVCGRFEEGTKQDSKL